MGGIHAMRAVVKMSRRDKVSAITNGRCWYCGTYLPKGKRTLDHVVPQVDGGTDAIENLVLACAPCNTRKGRMSLSQYRELHNGGKRFYGETHLTTPSEPHIPLAQPSASLGISWLDWAKGKSLPIDEHERGEVSASPGPIMAELPKFRRNQKR